MRFLPFLLLLMTTHLAAEPLSPGVYVAARDLDGAAILGAHQYLILVPQKPEAFASARDLGDGSKGIIVGAQNKEVNSAGDKTKRFLRVAYFNEADHQATREYVNAEKYTSRVKPDYDTEVHLANLNGQPVDVIIRKIMTAIAFYKTSEKLRPIPYPSFAVQIRGGKKCLNSNAWAQSVVEYTIGPDTVRQDFKGLDRCNKNRIPQSYFVK